METTQGKANKYILPLLMGFALAAVKIVCSTIQFKYYLEDFKASYIIFFVSLASGIAIILLTGILQKNRTAGATMKEIFQAMFLTILVGITLSYGFEQAWMYSDVTITDRIFSGKMNYLKTYPNSATKIEELRKEYLQNRNAKPTFGNLTTGLLVDIVRYSILGFIFALILNRKKTGATT